MTQKSRQANRRPSPNQNTRHHRIPRVRGEVVNQKWNILKVSRREHEAWHHVFGERTPLEAVMFIVEKLAPPKYFRRVVLHTQYDITVSHWQSNRSAKHVIEEWYRFVVRKKDRWPFQQYTLSDERQRSWHILFGGRSYYSAVHEIICGRWSPSGYFRRAHVRAGTDGVIQLRHDP